MKANCMIVQSGGPTAVINSSVIGVIDAMIKSGFKEEIYGAVGSIHGLINENFINLKSLTKENRYYLRSTPGAGLGTCRHKLTTQEARDIIITLKKYQIKYFFYIGGNGSMQVAHMIHEMSIELGYNLKVLGIPKSIDNDLLGTDHSPGYGSAAKFLATAVLDIKMDIASYPMDNRVTIIETMGRDTGWLAAACSLATYKNDDSRTMIYLPETPFEMNDFIQRVSKVYQNKQDVFLIIAEGIKNNAGILIDQETVFDPLNRPILGGVSSYIKKELEKVMDIQARAIAFNVWQRSNLRLASKTDYDEAYNIGQAAWEYASNNEKSGVMIGFVRDGNYKISYTTICLSKVAGQEKFVPLDWYDKQNKTMTTDFVEYALPLITGEVHVPMENGLPIYKQII